MHRKYNGKMDMYEGNIDFDIKHGVTRGGVIAFLDKIQNDSSFLTNEKVKVVGKESKNCR
jgi:hypothetical protein